MENIMHKISKIILGLFIAVLIVWQVPWLYNFMTYAPQRSPFTLYSSVVNEFVYTIYKEGEGLCRYDESGNRYNEKEFDEVLPLFFVRQLTTDDRFPDKIGGVTIIPKQAQMQNFVFRSIPSSLNKPEVGLYYLLESMSGRIDLSMPTDVFRFTNKGIEFVDANTNVIDLEKSVRFTEVMSSKGFSFPAQQVVGDPNTRKDYDQGYLIKDGIGKLFQLKMVKGRPFVKHIELPIGLDIKQLYITEYRGEKTLGFISAMDGKLYAIMNSSCEIKALDVPYFNPNREVITIFGNMLDWTVQITSENKETYYALDADTFKQIRTFSHQPEKVSFWEEWRNVLMPIRLSFTSSYDKWIYPRFNE